MFQRARISYISSAAKIYTAPRRVIESRGITASPLSRIVGVGNFNHNRNPATAYSSGSSLEDSSSCCGRGGYGVDLKSMGIGSNIASTTSAFHAHDDHVSSCGHSHHDDHHQEAGHSCSHHGGHGDCESKGNGGYGAGKCRRSEEVRSDQAVKSHGSCRGDRDAGSETSHHSAFSTKTASSVTPTSSNAAIEGGCPFHASLNADRRGANGPEGFVSAIATMGRPPSSQPSSKFAHIEDKFVRAMMEGAAVAMDSEKVAAVEHSGCQRHTTIANTTGTGTDALEPSVLAAARTGKCPFFAAAAQNNKQ